MSFTAKGKFRMPARRGPLSRVSAPTKKAMTKIAKNAVMRIAETKSYYQNFGSGFNNVSDVVTATNLNYSIAQGNTSESVQGEKLFLKSIKMRLQCLILNSAAAGNTNGNIRLSIIKTKKALTNTTAVITASDVYRSPTLALASTGHLDLHKVDVLYDKILQFGQPNISNADVTKNHIININVNKNHFYEADNAGYFKDKNYYLIVTAHKADVTLGASVAYIRGSWTVNFKDM